MSQEAVGAKMGVDRAYVGLIERGEQNVTLLTIWGVCEALDVRPAALFAEVPYYGDDRDQRPPS
ncbi:helix-turn-helix domain-containing protein [Sphingomonas sp.]|uniref:helix-turn-helix domain-containing protein n=1 Tax=Sphingomonas sp. TaxID=28214 RepID=UPI0025E8C682|nr:helix-turn-helix transcriptional regulator [Sphingomonas sp.]